MMALPQIWPTQQPEYTLLLAAMMGYEAAKYPDVSCPWPDGSLEEIAWTGARMEAISCGGILPKGYFASISAEQGESNGVIQ